MPDTIAAKGVGAGRFGCGPAAVRTLRERPDTVSPKPAGCAAESENVTAIRHHACDIARDRTVICQVSGPGAPFVCGRIERAAMHLALWGKYHTGFAQGAATGIPSTMKDSGNRERNGK
jgi:hypothetical protein